MQHTYLQVLSPTQSCNGSIRQDKTTTKASGGWGSAPNPALPGAFFVQRSKTLAPFFSWRVNSFGKRIKRLLGRVNSFGKRIKTLQGRSISKHRQVDATMLHSTPSFFSRLIPQSLTTPSFHSSKMELFVQVMVGLLQPLFRSSTSVVRSPRDILKNGGGFTPTPPPKRGFHPLFGISPLFQIASNLIAQKTGVFFAWWFVSS